MFHKLAAALVLVLTIALATTPAMAGTADDPEITDPAGDANFISPVAEEEVDSRPASLNEADLRAVWFETQYSVFGGQSVPTALLVRIETEAPIHPTQQVRLFQVTATLPGCEAVFELAARQNPATDSVTVRGLDEGCGNSAPAPVAPTYAGSVATLTFPLSDPQVARFIRNGTTVGEPWAQVRPSIPTGLNPVIDKTATGTSFTIGQDGP